MSFGDMGKQAKQPPPLLLTSHGECEEQYFYNLLENRYHTTRIPVLRNKSVLCSAFGWLVLLDQIQGECCLWNPTSSEIIHLPVVEHPSHYNRCFLSKSPTDPDCHILFSHVWTTIQIFCRIEDAAFTKSNLFEQGYVLVAIVSFKGSLYGIVKPAGIQKFEFATIHMAGDKIQAKPLLIDGEVPWEVPQALRSWISSNHVYLIESPCGDELLMVNKMASDMGGGVHFRIFRVDVDKMECEELDNLDGRTVFINYEGNGFCRSCESFGAAMKPNSICYTDIYGMVMYVHDLEDRSTITMLPYPDAHINPIMAKNFWVDIPMNLISYCCLRRRTSLGKIEAKPLLIDGEHPWEVPQPIRSWIVRNQDYLIESPCGNELLLVTKMAFNPDRGEHFKIYHVDVGRMECEELDNLDGRTFFINNEGNGFCRSYSESFGAAIKPNSIYYTNQNGMVLYVHDLDDRSTITLLPYPDADINPFWAKNYWVQSQ